MKIIKVELTIEEILEKVYEYTISNCVKLFGVKNEGITFHMVPNAQNCSILIAICCDDVTKSCASICEKILGSSERCYTDLHYLCAYTEEVTKEYARSYDGDYLSVNEIRYINLHSNSVIKITSEIVSKLLNIKWLNTRVVQCKKRDSYIFYYSKQFKDMANIDNEQESMMDYTKRIKDVFI